MATILVGTDDGLLSFTSEGEQLPPQHRGRTVTAVAPEGPDVWTILEGRELWLATAATGTMRHVATVEGNLRANCLADTRAGSLVGTSEANLLRVTEAGLERVDSFEETDGRDDWYTPWGGPPDVRSITEGGAAVYVNVHVGGIVRTTDEGAGWEPTIDIHADVHRVRATNGLVLAACALGLGVSEDRGASWDMRTEGLHAKYCRGVAVCGDTVLLSASVGPYGGRSAVYRGRLDGGPLERCREGLPEWFGDNIDSACLDATPDLAAFGTSDGRLFASAYEGSAWIEVDSGLTGVHCVLVVP
ncbi:MAG: hypothetical protein M3O88_02130 [Actinomycetota bacterium]|nr:hypothetical protein [Actinomycetota bacterium]